MYLDFCFNNFNVMETTINLKLTFNQLLYAVKQLPLKDKIKLSKELEKEGIDSRLSKIMDAFTTDELDESTILKETEIVRKEIYENKAT